MVAGDIAAKLFVSTTGQDADWVVKLIDVSPRNSNCLTQRRKDAKDCR